MSRELLSAEDARILALESGNVRGHTCKVLVIAGERGVDEVRAHLAGRLDAVPRLKRRLDPAAGPPAWSEDPAFSLERHVVAAGAVDDAGLLTLIAGAMTTRLERDRPLWKIDVVSLPSERTALVWRIHHALADGMTAMRMARALLLDPVAEEPAPKASSTSRQHAVTSRRTPASALRGASQVSKTLRAELGRRARRTPLDHAAGPRRDVAFVDAPLELLHRIGHAAPERATVNDVALSAVAGGLRSWLAQVGTPAAGLTVKVPVSLHHSGKHEAANRDSFMVVDLPLDRPDPLDRLVAVARETRECKRRHDAETLDAFFRDLSHLSSSLERYAEHWATSPRVFTLNVSNVPGPRGPQTVLGARLLGLHTLAEIAHGHALRVAIVSAAGRISFGLCADPDAVDGLDLIAHGMEREIDTLRGSLAVPPGPGGATASPGEPVG